MSACQSQSVPAWVRSSQSARLCRSPRFGLLAFGFERMGRRRPRVDRHSMPGSFRSIWVHPRPGLTRLSFLPEKVLFQRLLVLSNSVLESVRIVSHECQALLQLCTAFDFRLYGLVPKPEAAIYTLQEQPERGPSSNLIINGKKTSKPALCPSVC